MCWNPAFSSFSLADWTAWKGVGEASTKVRKSWAAWIDAMVLLEWYAKFD